MCPSHGILKEISKNSHAYLHIWSSNHMNEKHNWLSQDFKCSWMWDQRHHTCMGPCAISTTICKWRRWVRTEVGRSREFVLLCQAHKVDHGMASYVLMWWHDTIIYTPLIGVVVVHTWHMPAWWWYSIWTDYHMNTPGLLNVFIYMQVSPCFPVVVLDIFESSESWLLWRRA